MPEVFVFIDNGVNDRPGSIPLHNSRYAFNDWVLPIGTRYLADVARLRVPAQGKKACFSPTPTLFAKTMTRT